MEAKWIIVLENSYWEQHWQDTLLEKGLKFGSELLHLLIKND